MSRGFRRVRVAEMIPVVPSPGLSVVIVGPSIRSVLIFKMDRRLSFTRPSKRLLPHALQRRPVRILDFQPAFRPAGFVAQINALRDYVLATEPAGVLKHIPRYTQRNLASLSRGSATWNKRQRNRARVTLTIHGNSPCLVASSLLLAGSPFIDGATGTSGVPAQSAAAYSRGAKPAFFHQACSLPCRCSS